jgi:hypothetical protein
MARASRARAPKSVVDGTWRPNYEPPGPDEPPDTLTLAEGIYEYRTCLPPYRVPADGREHAGTRASRLALTQCPTARSVSAGPRGARQGRA